MMLTNYIREDRPVYRVRHLGPKAVATSELIATILDEGDDGMMVAHDILAAVGDLDGIGRLTPGYLARFDISDERAAALLAAIELGRRVYASSVMKRERITAPADAANWWMGEMMLLPQEEMRVMCLDTRNQVIDEVMVYRGSVNTAVIRLAEVFKPAIVANAPAIIIAHNHPSGDPSPSPEDINVTRQIVQAGKLMDIAVLDHVIIGHQRFVSLKERGLGFDD